MESYPVWELEFRSGSVSEGDELGVGYVREPDEKYITFWTNMHQPLLSEEHNFVLNVNDSENVVAVQLWDGGKEWIPLNTTEQRAAIARQAIRGVRDKFGNASYQHICPRCHNELPSIIGHCPNYIISMMGNTSSGKTVYMYRLILSLINSELLPGRGMMINVLSDRENLPVIRKRLKDMFFQAVEKHGEEDPAMAPAQSGMLAEATPIKYMKPTILDLQRENEHILITLFDFPGEAIWKLRDEDQYFFKNLMERTNENADGWLFLLDSTTFGPVREYIMASHDEAYLSQKDISDPELNAEPSDVLRQFSQFFGHGKQISAPVSLVFSKSDMISRYAERMQRDGYPLSADAPFLCDTPHTRRDKVDLDDLWNCDCALRRFLDNDQVLLAARTFCPEHAWFAVSATGAPVEGGRMEQMSPARRVVEPLEWLLWMLGAYAGEHTQGLPIWRTGRQRSGGERDGG